MSFTFSPQKPESAPLQKQPFPEESDEYLWINEFHESISDSVYQSAKWFDEFFIEEDSEISNPKTQARIRLGWRPKSRDWEELESRFRLKIRLPNLKNKVDLILSDDDDDAYNKLPLEGISSTNQETEGGSFTAAVRIINKDSRNKQLDTRIGISGGDIFSRIRYRKRFKWNNSHAFNVVPSVYYYLDDGLGAKLLLDYSYQLSDRQQLRVDYTIRGSESFSGIRWKHGFYQLSQINQTSASILGLQVEGERNGENGFIIDKYTLNYRYRFNAVRKWLYFEIEPFLEWPEEENYTTTPGVALRVEGYFQKLKHK